MFNRSLAHALIAVAFITITGAAAFAQPGTGFTISDADAVFSQGSSPSGSGGPNGTGAPGANFRVAGLTGPDNMFQSWWWYRINGTDTREFAFANATGTTTDANMAVTSWTYPRFTAQLTYTVLSAGPGAGRVRQQMRITNTSQTPLALAMFSYADFDLAASAGGDAAAPGLCPQVMRLTDGEVFAEYEAIAANAFAVAAFSGLRASLADTDIDNFTSTGLPFGPGDFSGGYQWTTMIPAAGSRTFEIELRLNVADLMGACCLPSGACEMTTLGCCREIGGVFQGDGIACAPGLCPQPPMGACCMGSCGCQIMLPAACLAAGGRYLGDDSVCTPVACLPRPVCPCNWNADDAVNSQDYFDFIEDLFDSRGDYNCDGFINTQDFFEFITCFVDSGPMCP